ncbi:ABC transporter substrate-binding protein [Bradyrhizobium sp. CCGUVB1N3]|uniref:ABC transporter substrate-binding protein n=1 Tax=Bradyrhizobium sp. CCGUVB1N3 TaxID=2949629 RepID=UPI0020B2C3E8|nr:ABC transporter substrate-binding protein [Bradyrhizobium sp. CCGUVB1N3]MCP3474097.1 ABC transporter substrate-binding protein [Bradyrhizobium sp. CCGUVB1N3]
MIDKVSLQLKWLHQAQFAGYYVAQEQGFDREEGLEIQIEVGGPGTDPERIVAEGKVDFAQGGGFESLLSARDNNQPLIAIAALFQKVDVVFVAKPATNIKSFADLKGKTISTWYTGIHLILRAILRANGIGLESVNEVMQAATLTPFLEGEVAVAAATFYNQLPALRERGFSDLVILDPAAYGVVIPRDTIITSEHFATTRPDVVQRFLQASLRGWKHAIENQADAVAAVMRRDPSLERRHQTIMMKEIAKLLTFGSGTSNGIGYIDPRAADFTHDFLRKHQQIARAVALDQAYTLTFWNAVASKYKAVA